MNHLRSLIAAAGIALAGASHAAITFSNFTYGPGTGQFSANQTVTANGISWSPLTYSRGGANPGILTLSWTYDATSNAGLINSIGATATSPNVGFTTGTGKVTFTESVFNLDSHGNETGVQVSSGNILLSGTGTVPVTTINLTTPSLSVRVKKTLILAADASSFAGVSGLGQTVNAVPEPASMAALALGGFGLLRRRKRA